MANILVCWTGQVTAPWPVIRVHAVGSLQYHSILKIVDAEWDRWHQRSCVLLLSEALSIYPEAVLVLYCFQPSYMIPGLFCLFTLYLHCMLHYKWVILHALLLHISTVLYLSIYSVITYYPILVCLGWLLITLFFIQYYTVRELFKVFVVF